MIDAKRMEVFGAIYKPDFSVILTEQAIILDIPFLTNQLGKGPLLCIGSGAAKTNKLFSNEKHFHHHWIPLVGHSRIFLCSAVWFQYW
jgi:hypothetical protein